MVVAFELHEGATFAFRGVGFLGHGADRFGLHGGEVLAYRVLGCCKGEVACGLS